MIKRKILLVAVCFKTNKIYTSVFKFKHMKTKKSSNLSRYSTFIRTIKNFLNEFYSQNSKSKIFNFTKELSKILVLRSICQFNMQKL